MSGGNSQTTTQKLAPELRPLASAYTDRAMQVANTPFQFYGGQRYAGFNPFQTQGFSMIQNRAMNGSPVAGAAEDQAAKTLNGGYSSYTPMMNQQAGVQNPFATGNNKYLQEQIDYAQQDLARNFSNVAKPQMEAAMARSGSFGNSGLQQMQQQATNDLQNSMGRIGSDMRMADYGQRAQLAENFANRQYMAGQQFADASNNSYQQERARQMQAMGLSPQLSSMGYQDAQQLLQAGQMQQNNQQNNLDFAYQQWQDLQNNPYKQLTAMGAPFGVNMGGSTVTSGGK